MQTRSPRTILAVSAAVALSAAALVPTAALGYGGGRGAGGCDGDCDNESAQVQQPIRARDGSGQQATTMAGAGRGQQIRAGVTEGSGTFGRGRAADDAAATRGRGWADDASRGRGWADDGSGGRSWADDGSGGRGWADDAARGPGSCEDCTAEMGSLTDIDVDGLLYMVDEEKLAHDVYAHFAELYDLPTFERIASSEARHQLAVETVLERYEIERDGLQLTEDGFNNEAMQQLYDDLVVRGEASLEEAIAVGILIEQTDIADLEERMEGLDETAPDVFEMYSHLQAASRQHLAAFERQA